VTDELWTSVVARIPTTRPINGFSVVAKISSRKSPPSSLNPDPRPLTPTRNPNKRKTTVTSRVMALGESWERGWRASDKTVVRIDDVFARRSEESYTITDAL
jgi:hypothetical protein